MLCQGAGRPLVFHFGTPNAPDEFPLLAEALDERGLQLIAHARPGYAGSTPQEGRTVADVAGDVAAILDHLGHDRFLTVGWSGGGPHALACAALLPDRCDGAAIVAGVAPYDAEGLDFLAGMGPENVEEFGLAATSRAGLDAFLEDELDEHREVTGEQLAGRSRRPCLRRRGPHLARSAAPADPRRPRPMSIEWHTVRTDDGRDLEVLRYGPAGGRALVSHVGTPSAPDEFRPLMEAVDERGWQLVSYARPGYSGSTRQPGRRVADAAADVAAILDHFGLDRFLTIGRSGGGPHALACAALLPDRCAAAATVASVAPFEAEGLDFTAGMGPENVEEYGAAATSAASSTPSSSGTRRGWPR